MTDVVKISLLNQTYIKIDCDLGILYELESLFTFEVPGAKFHPKVKLGIWDGKIRLLSVSKRTLYAGLHDILVDKCESLGYAVISMVDQKDVDITPEEIFSFVNGLDLHSNSSQIRFRDYQYHAVYTALRNCRQTLLSPTASGKSAIIYAITRYLTEQEKRVIIIVPTVQLVTQLFGDFRDYSSANGFDVLGNAHNVTSGKEKTSKKLVTISTWQSVFKCDVHFWNSFDCIIVDECHLASAASLTGILEKSSNVKYRLGFTGSLDNSKTNKLVIQGLFGPITKVTTTRELIDSGHLSDIDIKSIVLTYSTDTKKLCSHLDYQKEVDFLVSHERRNKFIRNLALSLTGNTLILYTLVEKHGDVLYRLLSEKIDDRPLSYVHGGIDAEDRELVREIIAKNDASITLASVGTFSTGINAPRINNIIFASPTKSVVRVLQSLGRGLRKSDNKTKVVVYDIGDLLYKNKTKQNHTYTHLAERLKIYASQEFTYKITEVPIEQ